MKIKTYRAKNLCEAFAKIREDLGGQAAILETREVRKRGILGLFPGGTMLEVTASDGLEEVCEDVQDSCPSVDPSLVRIADREFSEVHEMTLEKADVFEKKDVCAQADGPEMPSVAELAPYGAGTAGHVPVSVGGGAGSVSEGGVSSDFRQFGASSGVHVSDAGTVENDSIWDSICDLEGRRKAACGTGSVSCVGLTGREKGAFREEEALPFALQESPLSVQPGPFRKIRRKEGVCGASRTENADAGRSLFSRCSGTAFDALRTSCASEDSSTILSFSLGDRKAGDDSDSGLLFRDQTRFFHQSANCMPKLSAGSAAFQDALLQIYAKLQTADMDEFSIASLMDRLRNEEVLYAATGKRALSTDQDFLEKRLQELVAQEIQTSGPIPIQHGTRHVAALVGPTGVGKTTTIAKLAIDYRQRKNCQVGLITLDLSRMGAVEQLQTFADIISIPMLCVSTRRQMREAMARMADFDLVLIDTAGQSRADEMPLQELRMFFDAAQVNSVMLVLSSTSRTRILKKTVQSFESLGTTSLILTKLDEALGLGNLYPLLQETTLPVSYLTNGQKVPDDFETAERMRLARLILGDESCRP